MGTHQKVLIDNMKDQKNQLRKIEGQQPISQNNSNFAATILGLPSASDQHVLSGEMNNSIGVIGLSQQRMSSNRPVSRDSKVRNV